jgi:anti-sigma regulatory factor (Ser/Thr protein kinase)
VTRADAPPPWRREVSGDPAVFRSAAAAAAATAVGLGIPADRRDDLTLAVHELLVNAWEHGHLGVSQPPIRVEVARRDDGAVIVRVEDAAVGGRWDPAVLDGPADRGADRGRGLAIARALVEEVAAAAAAEHRTVVSLTVRRGVACG